MAKRSEEIRHSILREVFWQHASPVRRIAREYAVTPQAVLLHVRRLVDEGHLRAYGERRHRRYQRAIRSTEELTYPLDGTTSEDKVWDGQVRDPMRDLDMPAQDICHYGLTEMVNNAIDHSGGRSVSVKVVRTCSWPS